MKLHALLLFNKNINSQILPETDTYHQCSQAKRACAKSTGSHSKRSPRGKGKTSPIPRVCLALHLRLSKHESYYNSGSKGLLLYIAVHKGFLYQPQFTSSAQLGMIPIPHPPCPHCHHTNLCWSGSRPAVLPVAAGCAKWPPVACYQNPFYDSRTLFSCDEPSTHACPIPDRIRPVRISNYGIFHSYSWLVVGIFWTTHSFINIYLLFFCF